MLVGLEAGKRLVISPRCYELELMSWNNSVRGLVTFGWKSLLLATIMHNGIR